LMNNVFTNALPTEAVGTGAVLCGDNLGSNTQLNLRADNVFPVVPPTDPPTTQACEQLPQNSAQGCDFGQVFAHNGASNVVRTCEVGVCQCAGGSAQCVVP
jgi:hypothetical protein